MRFYKRLPAFDVLSFDLDDTLYDNMPVILKAEQAQMEMLKSEVSASVAHDIRWWRDVKQQVIQQKPELMQDMTKLRFAVLQQGLLQVGVPELEAAQLAQRVFDEFYHWRNQVSVEQDIHQLMSDLAAAYPLVAVTNGNVDLDKIGLASYFSHRVSPVLNQHRMKPHVDMFQHIASQAEVSMPQLLHIGDSLTSDVKGARNAGCGAIWLNQSKAVASAPDILPHIEIHDIRQLADLLL